MSKAPWKRKLCFLKGGHFSSSGRGGLGVPFFAMQQGVSVVLSVSQKLAAFDLSDHYPLLGLGVFQVNVDRLILLLFL